MKMIKSLHRLARCCSHSCTGSSPGLVPLTVALALAVPIQADDFLFQWIDGSLSIVGYQGTNSVIVVPSSFEGSPVTSVENLRVPKMVSCTFSEGIVSIGRSALNGCWNLTNVTFPSSLTTIGSRAFADCHQLSSVVIGSGVTNLGASAFEGSGLRSVSLPDGLVEIGVQCFAGTGLTHIAIPKSVTNIRNLAFSSPSLSGVDVDPDNPAYSSLDGALYNKDRTRLILVPPTKKGTCQLPGTVEIIGARSCRYSGLTDLVLPASVKEIESYGFEGWFSGQRLFFLGDAPVLGSFAFEGCYQLTVYRLAGASGWGANFGGRYVMLWSQDFGYTTTNGCAVLTSYLGPKNEEITIPDSIDGLKVTELGDGLFDERRWVFELPSRNVWLRRVTIPDTVTTIGSAAFYGCRKLVSCRLPAALVTVRSSAFASCASLTDVRLPDTVRSLGGSAFSECTGLTNISLSSGLTSISAWTFVNCTSLTEVVIPEGVTNIAETAFSNCRSLSNLTLPDSLEFIGSSAFSECSGLTNIEWGNGLIRIDESAFLNCSALPELTVPDGVTEVGGGAFNGCSALRTVKLGANVTNIGTVPFLGCGKLESITVNEGNPAYSSADGVLLTKDRSVLLRCPQRQTGAYAISGDVRNIADRSFDGCKELTAVNIPEGVTAIPSLAFSGCENLTSVSCPDGLTAIGPYAFQGCRSLRTISIPSSVRTLDPYFASGSNLGSVVVDPLNTSFSSFDGLVYDKGQSKMILCPPGKLGTVILPATVSDVGNGFGACLGVSALLVDSSNPSLTSIEGVLFNKNATTLLRYPPGKAGSYRIPDGVTSIAASAFENCPNLTSLIVPERLTNMQNIRINGSQLTAVCFLGDAPVYGFSSAALATVYHLASAQGWETSYNGYPTALWSPPFTYEVQAQEVRITRLIPDGATVSVPSSIEGLPVTRIAARAFADSTTITQVSLPTGVTRIEPWAFQGCAALKTVAIPETVTEIGEGAFARCTMLNGVTLPQGTTAIADWAFAECTSLAECVISESVKRIGVSAFDGCTGLERVVGAEGLEQVDSYAFFDCARLSEFTWPDTLQTVGPWAFAGCASLPELDLPLAMITLGEAAFFGCSSLQTVSIPASVQTIGEGAFAWCDGLDRIDVDTLNPGYAAVDGALFSRDQTLLLQCPAGKTGRYQVPETVAAIAGSAFAGCAQLTGLALPDTVISIGPNAFEYCRGLSSLTLPPALKEIGERALEGCDGLTRVTVPANVSAIGSWAFADCPNLQGVYFEGDCPDISATAFYNLDCTVHYLPGTTGWVNTCAGQQTTEWQPELLALKPEVTGQPERFEVQGFWAPGKTLVLDAATDLANPAWTAVSTNTVASDGTVRFNDPDYRVSPFRIYRARTP